MTAESFACAGSSNFSATPGPAGATRPQHLPMTLRAIFLLLGCALAAAHAATDTYQRSESFETRPAAWRYFNPNQGFGYFPSSTGGKGDAGGFFFPKTYTAYYADTSLNGVLHRDTPIRASGSITLDELSFDPNYTNSVYVAHIRKGSTKDMFVNILGIALTGDNAGNILCAPVVQFSNGDAFLGKAIQLPVDSASHVWSYTWDPSGGAQGLGLLTIEIDGLISTLTMGQASVGIDYTLDSFGLYQPAFVQPNSNSYFIFFIGDLSYTALTGPSPKIKIKGPSKITTSAYPLPLTGTTHTTLGNRVTAVRYRVVHDGKVGKYKKATGIDNWSASVRVPTGTSRVEVTAVGDNGRTTTAHRTVTRTP
jgi:hypothetical protein